jgi:tetratricopeptide (TPR) repeat protein
MPEAGMRRIAHAPSFSLLAVVVTLVIGMAPLPLLAQERAPLQKSEIVRLLTSGTYSAPEVATIIRQNCLSFNPTTRDLTDFRALGADQAILDEIDRCVREAPVQTGVSAAGIVVRQASWDAQAGGEATIVAFLLAGGTPVQGERLVLAGAASIEGGTGLDPTAVTGEDGRAVFSFSAGTAARGYDLVVRSLDLPTRPPAGTRLQVSSGAPAIVDADEGLLDPAAGPIGLRLVVRDAWGNPVPGAPLVLLAGDDDGTVLFEGAAREDGSLTVRLPEAALEDVPRVTVRSGDTRLAALAVARPQRAGSILVISGGSQVAEPGQVLLEPLVIEVRDGVGAPVPGVAVRLSASDGDVTPERASTDSDGRVKAVIRLGAEGTETRVRIETGSIEREIVYSALRAGRSVAEVEADLDEADRLLAAGDIAAARVLYDEVARYDPPNRRAALGRTRAALAVGQAGEAAGWAESILERDPEDAEAWLELANARRALEDEDAARFAYEQALLLDPGFEEADAALAELEGRAVSEPVLALEAWGGTTVDDDRGFVLPYAEARVVPASWIELRATWDDMLGLRTPFLVRGRDALQSLYGAAALRYGADDRFVTVFEAGRRDQPEPDGEADDVYQTSWRLEQAIPLSGSATLRLGGWLGRWYDRDDKALYGEALFALGSGLALRPMLSWADNAGSNVTGDDGEPGTGRDPESEIRGGIGLRVESPGWSIEPAIAYGSVDSEDDAFDGGLLDLTTRARVELGGSFSLSGFVRYQSPPGTPSFVTVAVGLGLALQ